MGMPCKKLLLLQTAMTGRKNLFLVFRGGLLMSKSQLIKLLLVLLIFNHEKETEDKELIGYNQSTIQHLARFNSSKCLSNNLKRISLYYYYLFYKIVVFERSKLDLND
jgi:hypothetical protein